ncbi:hypothetical protein BAE44_0000239 [Dichanthelium oligosanthes]|uniref:Uncharacterized protein n=1 Tax=Dichanthelium oligosanthes TaxID=888268 RepID=A0A1E5WMW0_9POAL|nr:hypothetical protein BAE44_0000239 [Dichanthelium oligosanthes]
MRRYADPLA